MGRRWGDGGEVGDGEEKAGWGGVVREWGKGGRVVRMGRRLGGSKGGMRLLWRLGMGMGRRWQEWGRGGWMG